jgi:hypothetical protein
MDLLGSIRPLINYNSALQYKLAKYMDDIRSHIKFENHITIKKLY